MLTVSQFAKLVNRHPSLIRRWVRDGTIKAEKITPRLYLIPDSERTNFKPRRKGRPAKPAPSGK